MSRRRPSTTQDDAWRLVLNRFRTQHSEAVQNRREIEIGMLNLGDASIAKWATTSFGEHPQHAQLCHDVEHCRHVVVAAHQFVRDTNRAFMPRCEVRVIAADGSRWRLYPQAAAIYEDADRVAAEEVGDWSHFRNTREILKVPELDKIGRLEAVKFSTEEEISETMKYLWKLKPDHEPEESFAAGIEFIDGKKFQWWRYFASYCGRDLETLFPKANTEKPEIVSSCMLLKHMVKTEGFWRHEYSIFLRFEARNWSNPSQRSRY